MTRTVVIGGGAAGIAAARRLHDAGRDVLLVEAGGQLGGRARTWSLALPDHARSPATPSSIVPTTPQPDREGASESAPRSSLVGQDPDVRQGSDEPDTGDVTKPVPVDAGCGWLHSAGRNSWTAIAEADGFVIDRASPNWGVQWRDLRFPPAEQQAFRAAWNHWNAAAHAALNGPDRPLSAFIAADDPWRPMLQAISGYANGAPLEQVSLHDWATYEDASTDDNWALPAGYGTLIAHHAGQVPARLHTRVTRIDHGGRTLRIETNAGTIEADSVILCVPTSAYARITFDPPLPAKQDAAAVLPLGLADKVFLFVDGPEWPAHTHLTGDPHSACTASHRLSPFGRPIVESFFGGPCAEGMESREAASAFAVDELVALLGSDWRRRLHPLAATRWREEPFIHGSYSHAAVGHAPARAVLAEPVDDRLFFAGEACSRSDFSTAHGAYDTGIAAAEAILAGTARPQA